MSTPKRVLIVCTGNACRSQLAEGLWRQLGGEQWECHSAGARPAGFVHPLAVRVAEELGVDLSTARSKHIAEFRHESFDLVVTVCDRAREGCPVHRLARRTLHWPFEDPAYATGSEADQLQVFRRVRDEIAAAIRAFLADESAA